MKLLGYLLGLVGVGLLLFFAIGFFIPSFEYQTAVMVDKSAAQSYKVYLDESLIPVWMTGLRQLELMEGKPNEVGSQYRVVVKKNSGTDKMIKEVLEYKPNELYAYKLTRDHMSVDIFVRFKEINNQTKITATSIITGKNIFWKSMLPLDKGNFEREDQFLYDRLKSVIEAQ